MTTSPWCREKVMVYYYYLHEASAQVTDYFASRKKEGTIQYGYRKWVTHARVFSQTLRMGTARMK